MKNRIGKGDKRCTLLERCQNATDSRCIALKALKKIMQQLEADSFSGKDLQKMVGG